MPDKIDEAQYKVECMRDSEVMPRDLYVWETSEGKGWCGVGLESAKLGAHKYTRTDIADELLAALEGMVNGYRGTYAAAEYRKKAQAAIAKAKS